MKASFHMAAIVGGLFLMPVGAFAQITIGPVTIGGGNGPIEFHEPKPPA